MDVGILKCLLPRMHRLVVISLSLLLLPEKSFTISMAESARESLCCSTSLLTNRRNKLRPRNKNMKSGRKGPNRKFIKWKTGEGARSDQVNSGKFMQSSLIWMFTIFSSSLLSVFFVSFTPSSSVSASRLIGMEAHQMQERPLLRRANASNALPLAADIIYSHFKNRTKPNENDEKRLRLTFWKYFTHFQIGRG